jgi:hypothetical protein
MDCNKDTKVLCDALREIKHIVEDQNIRKKLNDEKEKICGELFTKPVNELTREEQTIALILATENMIRNYSAEVLEIKRLAGGGPGHLHEGNVYHKWYREMDIYDAFAGLIDELNKRIMIESANITKELFTGKKYEHMFKYRMNTYKREKNASAEARRLKEALKGGTRRR